MKALTVTTVALAVLVLGAAAMVKHSEEVRGRRTVQRLTHTSDRNALRVSTNAKLNVITDPPVDQPHGMVVMFTQYCNDTLTLVQSQIFAGGWKVTPPETLYPANSGKFNLGFEGEADPGTDIINGTLTYQASSYGIAMAFVAIQGEWAFEVEYETYLGVLIQSADVGKKAVYNLVIGRDNGDHCAPTPAPDTAAPMPPRSRK
jgi:hypothetical protein